jgi:hypothetical protein
MKLFLAILFAFLELLPGFWSQTYDFSSGNMYDLTPSCTYAGLTYNGAWKRESTVLYHPTLGGMVYTNNNTMTKGCFKRPPITVTDETKLYFNMFAFYYDFKSPTDQIIVQITDIRTKTSYTWIPYSNFTVTNGWRTFKSSVPAPFKITGPYINANYTVSSIY